MDSIKVYRGLDIGTAKPSATARSTVPVHMVDVVDPCESFSLARYLEGSKAAVASVEARGKHALFVGGTPLYLRGLLYGIFDGPPADWNMRKELQNRAAVHGSAALHRELAKLDPLTAERLHPNDLTRIIRALEVLRKTGKPISKLQRQYPAPRPAVKNCLVALRRSEEDLRDRINRRTDRMFRKEIVDEVRRALDSGGLCRSARKAIGYREVLQYLEGEYSLDETIEQVKRNTWRLARKQRTWLNAFPGIAWLDVPRDEPCEETSSRVQRLMFSPEQMN